NLPVATVARRWTTNRSYRHQTVDDQSYLPSPDGGRPIVATVARRWTTNRSYRRQTVDDQS
ncbi:MAG: hypothetical protein NXI32_29795, partial [bacterium]|nr:hypothetical protein [bacterium]